MPTHEHIYDPRQTFEENMTYGPFWNEPLPEFQQPHWMENIMGYKVNSKLGVAASPLTANSRYIELMSKLGYDVLTYKSVRSCEWRGNRFPHWAFVDAPGPFSNAILQSYTVMEDQPEGQKPSGVNSFGIHSVSPDIWQPDVDRAVSVTGEGQIMILSLMCTPTEGEPLVRDAVRLASLASETQAYIFELNLACPNTDGGQGLIYEDLALSLKLADAMKNRLGDFELLLKVGRYKNQEDLKKLMRDSKGIIDGISTTNTYSAKVSNPDGSEYFPGRPTAGVSGAVIKLASQEQARNAVRYRQELGLENFAIMGIGGVTEPSDINEYDEIGVDGIQAAMGVFANPLLAAEWKNGK